MKKYLFFLVISIVSCYSYAQVSPSSAVEEPALPYEEEAAEAVPYEAALVREDELPLYHQALNDPVSRQNSLGKNLSIVTALFFLVLLSTHIYQRKKEKSKVLDPFAITGILTSLISIYYVSVYFFGIIQALDDIQLAGDISPTVIAGASKIILISGLRCLVFGIITLVFGIVSRIWFRPCLMNKASFIIIALGAITTAIAIMSFVITPVLLNSLLNFSI